jgi:DNA-binding MarR family transcriptional regulator
VADPELALRFARAVQALAEASHGLSERFSRAHDLGLADVRALVVLAMAGEPVPAGELARRVALSSGAATRLVDRLEASGHVVRFRDPADRRRVLVSHTDTATATAQAWFGPLGARLAARLDGLTDEQARLVVDMVEGIVEDVRSTGADAPAS